jgi:cell division protein FtsL
MSMAHALTSPRFRSTQAVTKTERVKGVFVTYLILLILLAFTCCLFYIWSRIQIVNVGYEINRELTAKEKLVEENKRLAMEVATLRSPVRLESLAKNDYHMDLPQKSQILSEGPSKILEVSTVLPLKPEVAKLKGGLKTPAKAAAALSPDLKKKSSDSILEKKASVVLPKTSAVTPKTTVAKKVEASTVPAKKETVKKATVSKEAAPSPLKTQATKGNSPTPLKKPSVPKVALSGD